MMTKEQMKEFSPIILRYGLAIVFLWFGTQQLLDPSAWLGYLPDEVKYLPISPINFIIINAVFEIAASLLLALGIFTRIVSLLLALHMIGITIAVGYNEIGIRDFGLSVATLAICLNGTDKWCLENIWKKKIKK